MSYRVTLCLQDGCHHPGGQHILGGGCRLCDACSGWWSDDQQDAAEQAASGDRS